MFHIHSDQSWLKVKGVIVQRGLVISSVYLRISWSVSCQGQHHRCLPFFFADNNRPGRDRQGNRKLLHRKDRAFLNSPHCGRQCFCPTDIPAVGRVLNNKFNPLWSRGKQRAQTLLILSHSGQERQVTARTENDVSLRALWLFLRRLVLDPVMFNQQSTFKTTQNHKWWLLMSEDKYNPTKTLISDSPLRNSSLTTIWLKYWLQLLEHFNLQIWIIRICCWIVQPFAAALIYFLWAFSNDRHHLSYVLYTVHIVQCHYV